MHRVGDLAIGDLAVVLAVLLPHRAEAFDACRDLIDILKASVPIWSTSGSTTARPSGSAAVSRGNPQVPRVVSRHVHDAP